MSPTDSATAGAQSTALPPFVFTCCQVGAERALKAEIGSEWPASRFAFSRPGFVTFRFPDDAVPPARFDLKSIFARTYGFSVGKATGDSAEALAAQAWDLLGDRQVNHIHVWQRDAHLPGERGFWPGPTVLAEEVGTRLAQLAPPTQPPSLPVNQRADADESVLDCVLVEPHEWWIGFHHASAYALRWPGGVVPTHLPSYAVSRAYAKMHEALEWSRFPILPGDNCVEIGSAPGGASQALLDRGALVTGIDPAEMDPQVVAQQNFTWVRKRGSDVKRRDYGAFRWLTADVNMAPNFTLDMLADIVQHEAVRIHGMLLTLKLLDWKLAADIPAYLERIRSWGYRYVRVRQLASNRQEVCVVALKSRASRRGRPKR